MKTITPKIPGGPPPAFVERRHDQFTRAVVDSKLTADEARQLPQGEKRVAAVSKVVQVALSEIWYPTKGAPPPARPTPSATD